MQGTLERVCCWTALSLATISMAGCVEAPADPGAPLTETVAASLLDGYPQPLIGFETQPAYLPKNAVALTFDDGPDEVNTPAVLDILKREKIKATFFINSGTRPVESSAALKAVIKRIVAEGHELGNHSVRHLDWNNITDGQILEEELAGVERLVRRPDVLGPSFRLTLVRAPFGHPYSHYDDPTMPPPGINLVSPIVGKRAVHVGWALTNRDTAPECASAECVLRITKERLKTVGTGWYGVILLHSVLTWTVQALPDTIKYIRDNGFQFITVEDAVRAKFGRSSTEVVDQWPNLAEVPDAGAPAPAPDGGGADVKSPAPPTPPSGMPDAAATTTPPTDPPPTPGSPAATPPPVMTPAPDAAPIPSCKPQCDGRECGDDGCGDVCGTCPVGRSCSNAGRCSAAPGCGFGF
jgi:peptidoglycan/xylan/chitin deacetylase (PgdA/CDA1 family)